MIVAFTTAFVVLVSIIVDSFRPPSIDMFPTGTGSPPRANQIGFSPFPLAEQGSPLGTFRASSGFRCVTGEVARPPAQPRPSFRPQDTPSTTHGVHIGVRPRPMPPASGPGAYVRATAVTNGWDHEDDSEDLRRGSWDRSAERIHPSFDRSSTAPLEMQRRPISSASTPQRPRSTASSTPSSKSDQILARMQSMIPAQEPPTEAPRDVVDSVYTFDYSAKSSPGKRKRAYPPPPTHELAYGAPAASRIGAWRRLRAVAEAETPVQELQRMSLGEATEIRKSRSRSALREGPERQLERPAEQLSQRSNERLRQPPVDRTVQSLGEVTEIRKSRSRPALRADLPLERPIERSHQLAVERAIDKPIERPAELLSQQPNDRLRQPPIQPPAQPTAERPKARSSTDRKKRRVRKQES